jgi:iron(III) transport system permease protein
MTAAFAPSWRAIRRRPERALVVAAAAIACVVALPVAALAIMALSGEAGFTAVFLKLVLPRAAMDTALLLLGVGALAASIGVGAAWLVSAYRFPGRDLLSALLAAPLAMPTYIAAYVWVEILEPLGPVQRALRAALGVASPAEFKLPAVRSLGGAILIFSLVLFPYVYLATRAVFMTQSASLLEAARALGRGPWLVFWRVGLPLARPATAAGMALILLETLNDVGASEYLGVRTLTVTVMQTWTTRNSLPGAAILACGMLLIVACVLAAERAARNDRRFAISVQKPRLAEPTQLNGARATLAAALCAIPVIVGFLIPAGFLFVEAAATMQRRGLDADFLRQLRMTGALASAATLAAIALGLVVVLAHRASDTPLARAATRVASLGYAVPGSVLAVGLLAPLTGLDAMLSWLFGALAGTTPALWITGSGLGLVFAYTIRFLTVAIGAMESQLSRYSPRVDQAARALGRDALGVAREIHLPLLRPAVGAAALLIFIDCVKELPATLLLRSLNVETLATALYAHASRGAFEDGAPQALAIVAVGLLPVLKLGRRAAPELDVDRLKRERA